MEVKSQIDLERCFLMRYAHLKKSAHQLFLPNSGSPIDLDLHDWYCTHWAVYDACQNIIGYARIIQKEKNQAIASAMQAIAEEYQFTDLITKMNLPPFPMQSYQPEETQENLEKHLQAYHRTIELSRFIILPQQSIRILKFMVNAGLGIYKYYHRIDQVVLACRDKHERFWNQYGFQNIAGDQTYYVGPLKSVNLFSELKELREDVLEKMKAYATQFKQHQKIAIEL